MSGTEICTYSGKIIDPLNPDPKLICIEDIAHSLSQQCRFTGHTTEFYSVGQHSVLVSLDTSLETGEEQRGALLHDSTETYLSDLARPIKHLNSLGKVYREVERGLEIAVAERFGLTYPFPESVKKVDDELLLHEAVNLMPPEFWNIWGPKPTVSNRKMEVVSSYGYWLPKQAESQFLARFYYLFK
jgi:hypothetical protein